MIERKPINVSIISNAIAILCLLTPAILILILIYDPSVIFGGKPGLQAIIIFFSFVVFACGISWMIGTYAKKIIEKYTFVKNFWIKMSIILAFPVFIFVVLPAIHSISNMIGK